MGSYFSRSINDNFKKNQEFILEQQVLQLERQIQMRSQFLERQEALRIAKDRELLYWFGAFYIVATAAMVAGFKRNKTPSLLVPILPMTFILAYQGDLAYGSKIHRIRCEAENIMEFESPLVEMPFGSPTFTSIEDSREERKERENLQRAHDIFL